MAMSGLPFAAIFIFVANLKRVTAVRSPIGLARRSSSPRPVHSNATSGLRALGTHDARGDVTSARLDSMLWDGLDTPLEFGISHHWSKDELPPERNVHIFGLQDSGTNLLMSMLLKNFGTRLRFFDFSYAENATGNYGHGLWKHINLRAKFDAEPEAFDPLQANDVVPIMMVREPLSWLQSVRKAPYELKWCIAGSEWPKSDWLKRECVHPIPAGFNSSAKRVPYSSLEEIWNQWTEAYQHASHLFSSGGCIVRYEDLVADPELEMQRIARHLGIREPKEFQIMTSSAKTHGESVGRNEALIKINSKSYLQEFFVFQRVQACSRLGNRLMRTLEYRECDGFGGPGSELVDEFGHFNKKAVQMSLWAGMDIPEDKVFVEGVVEVMSDGTDVDDALQTSLAPMDAPFERSVQILGLQHTGTSLFSALLTAAFGSRLRMYDQLMGVAEGSDLPAHAAGIWKHSDIEALHSNASSEMDMVARGEVYALAMIRDPLSWLEALHREPRELRLCTSGSTSSNATSWITRPCVHEAPGGEFSALGRTRYSSVGGVWSHWVKNYEEASTFGFKGGLEIRYEDLIEDPQFEMARIADFLGIDAPRTDAAELLAQEAGEQRLRALEYANEQKYLNFFSATKTTVCQTLEEGAMSKHGYLAHDCPPVDRASLRRQKKLSWMAWPSISHLDFLTEGLLRRDKALV